MKIIDILYMVFKNMAHSVSRIILPAAAVAIGTASVILISSVGKGTALEAEAQFNALGVDGLCLSVKNGKFDEKIADRIENEVANVEVAVPFDYASGSVSAHQRKNKAVFFGTGENPCKALGIELLYGRDFSVVDITDNARIVIVGEEYAQSSYERSNIVGKVISLTMNGITANFTVVGVVSSQTERLDSLLGADPGNIIYMPYTAMNEIRNGYGTENIAVKLKNTEKSDKTGTEILKLVKHIGQSNSGYSIQNISSYLEKARNIIEAASLLVTAVGGVSMLVASLGVMNTVFAGIERRRYEIGLLMAIGALDRHIKLYVLFESVFTCILGGITGLILSELTGLFLKTINSIPFAMDYKAVIAAELISIVCGALAGIVPALKAAAMEPVDALKNR